MRLQATRDGKEFSTPATDVDFGKPPLDTVGECAEVGATIKMESLNCMIPGGVGGPMGLASCKDGVMQSCSK
jgi:hypothetical protein